ncbi:hypothetical protein DM02DRAFT_615426 [Periconia macrospinosa]|uniref:P-loop containing nucleoside triphosphate hydrolase protein n=1 Tax=Periconia macrospinosa TaxID=97972 RepID=A0A2V1DP77_9PLEO|nr:hypothetical protein DM02DRAFT_615426 [Periconia macrospinosa]
MDYQRIVIVGKPGSGKTTLSRQLAEILSLKPVEIDAIHWQPDWTQLDAPMMRQRVGDALPVDGHWVADGNYKEVRDIAWGRADTLIWLDYGLLFTLWRLFWRTLGRIVFRKTLWNGNKEVLTNHLSLDRDKNIFLYMIGTHSRQRKQFPADLKEPQYSHLRVLRFRTASELDSWVHDLTRLRS